MKRKTYCLAFLLLMLAAAASAALRRVPQQYNTIQAAINAAAHSDTVLVEPGIYFENIQFRGKRLVVASRFLLNSATFFPATAMTSKLPFSIQAQARSS